MIQKTVTGPEPVATQAAEWIDRLRDANAQDHSALREWLRQSPKHFEELMYAAAIDLAIHVLADRNLLTSVQFPQNTGHPVDLAPELDCAPAAVPATQQLHVDADRPGERERLIRLLPRIRACALAIIADEGAAEQIAKQALQRLRQLPDGRSVPNLEREALSTARAASRAWLEQRHSRHVPDDPLPLLAQWRKRLRTLGARRMEVLVCIGCLGQPIRQVALSMAIDTRAALQELSQGYLHLMGTLDDGQSSRSSIAYRSLSRLKLRFRR